MNMLHFVEDKVLILTLRDIYVTLNLKKSNIDLHYL